MLPKSQRLSTEAFKKVIEKGQSFHCPFLILRAVYAQGTTKIAVSVPKKVAKTAVSRNIMRRRVYSIVRDFSFKPNLDIVVILKEGITRLSFKDLAAETEKIFVKSAVLK